MKKNRLFYLYIFTFYNFTVYSQDRSKTFEEFKSEPINNNESSKRYEFQIKNLKELETKQIQELIEENDNIYTQTSKKHNKKNQNETTEIPNPFMNKDSKIDNSKENYEYFQPQIQNIDKSIDLSGEDWDIIHELYGENSGVGAGIMYHIQEFKKSTSYQRRLLIDKIIPIRFNKNNDYKIDFGIPIYNIFKLFNEIYDYIFV